MKHIAITYYYYNWTEPLTQRGQHIIRDKNINKTSYNPHNKIIRLGQ